jgi:hypothetical protein
MFAISYLCVRPSVLANSVGQSVTNATSLLPFHCYDPHSRGGGGCCSHFQRSTWDGFVACKRKHEMYINLEVQNLTQRRGLLIYLHTRGLYNDLVTCISIAQSRMTVTGEKGRHIQGLWLFWGRHPGTQTGELK